MSSDELDLMAHLLRRAGFGASRLELEEYASKRYEDVVEDLLHPERFPFPIEDDIARRYFMDLNSPKTSVPQMALWLYRMIHTKRPLEEKIALFWHYVFATSQSKSGHAPSSLTQIDMFRQNGMGDFRAILTDMAQDPAMIHWLDNQENHKDEINENWGRELLELFSMGVGNYTEDDVQMASRAFTGWSFTQPIPIYPYSHYSSEFLYIEDDHDDSVKTFLGETGRFNGEDIIDIVVKQPATAKFISRHLYNFFVADEPPVPVWPEASPQDPHAIDTLVKTYFDSGGSIHSMLRVMFNSEFFKKARFKKVKSPIELVTGTVKMCGTYGDPTKFFNPPLMELYLATRAMGQAPLHPPTVEGWHTGQEWIDGGSLNERVNFAVDEVSDYTNPGVQAIIKRFSTNGEEVSPQQFVDQSLELAGPMTVGQETQNALLEYAESEGNLRFGNETNDQHSSTRIACMLQLIVSSIEYQFG